MPPPHGQKKPSLRTMQRRRKKARDAVLKIAGERHSAATHQEELSLKSSVIMNNTHHDLNLLLNRQQLERKEDNDNSDSSNDARDKDDIDGNTVDNCNCTEVSEEEVVELAAEEEHHASARVYPFDPTKAASYFKLLMETAMQHNMSQSSIAAMWDLLRIHGRTIHLAPQEQFKTFPCMRQGLRDELDLPEVLIDVEQMNNTTNETKALHFERRLHRKPDENWTTNHVFAYVTLESLLKMHMEKHECADMEGLVLGIDGIPESKSGARSLILVTVQFLPCLSIYPLQVFRPMNKKDASPEQHLGRIVEEITHLQVRLIRVVADAPMRAFLRGIKSHSGYQSCDFCEIFGSLGQGASVCFPPATVPATPRTNERFRNQVDIWLRAPAREKEDPKHMGIRHLSPFLSLEQFDIVEGIAPEFLHLISLGVVKRVLLFIFEVKKNYMSADGRKMKSELDKKLMKIQVPREFSRRTRGLNFATMKGEELRNVMYFFFPILLDIEVPLNSRTIRLTPAHRKIVLLLAYIIRAYTLPNDEFAAVPQAVLSLAMQRFQGEYLKAFGKEACSYNFHVLSHLDRIRDVSGPITVGSATPFESYFATVKARSVPNCGNPAKLLMEQLILHSALKRHACKPTVCITRRSASRQDNSVFRAGGFWYRAEEENEDSFICTSINTTGASWDIEDNEVLEFEFVGVFKIVSFGTTASQHISKETITGKGIVVENYLMYAPANVLKEC